MSNLLIKSLNLGFFDSIINWFIGLLTDLLMLIVNWTIDLLITIFAEFLYSIGLTLLNFVDFFQAFFNALSGIGKYWDTSSSTSLGGLYGEGWGVAGVQATEGDPLFSLITNRTVLQVFLALTAVAVIMLVLTTIIAMIRTEYTTEGAKNTKGNIIGQALKSLAMFFLVPAFCVFGIVLSNALLKTIYNATSGGDNVTAGAMVWYASSYNANRVRIDDDFYSRNWGKSTEISADFSATGYTENARETVAVAIDNAFKNRTPVVNGPKMGSESYTFTELMVGADATGGYQNRYSYRNILITEQYYSIRSMNFITMYLGGGIAIYIMFIAAFGMIIRLYKCAILFIISAPISALTPLDGGAAFKNWRKLMIGSVCSAFSVVVAFNLVFLLIPIFNNINIFNPNLSILTSSWNRLVNLIFVLSGLYSIKETSKWVASMLGVEDALAAGSEIAGKVMGTVGKIGTVAGAGVAGVAGKFIGAKMRQNADASLAKALEDGSVTEKKDENGNVIGYEGTNEAGRQAVLQSQKADKFQGRVSAISGAGKSVIGKTITKQMTRFDDFMGGAEVFGGQGKDGPKGLGGIFTKGADKLYDEVTDRAAAGLAGRGSVLHQRDQLESDIYNATHESYQVGTNPYDGTPIMATRERADSELSPEELSRLNDMRARRERLNVFGNGKRERLQYVRGTNAASRYSAGITDEAATFGHTVRHAQDNAELIEKNVGDALRAAAMYGGLGAKGSDGAKAKQAAEEAAKELAKALQIPLKDVFASLAKDGGKDLLDRGQAPLRALEQYRRDHDVATEGFSAAKIDAAAAAAVKAAQQNPGANINIQSNYNYQGADPSKTLSAMLTAQGVIGKDLSEQLQKGLEQIKAEQAKFAQEAKKKEEEMLKLATMIAKQQKKLNPYKGK